MESLATREKELLPCAATTLNQDAMRSPSPPPPIIELLECSFAAGMSFAPTLPFVPNNISSLGSHTLQTPGFPSVLLADILSSIIDRSFSAESLGVLSSVSKSVCVTPNLGPYPSDHSSSIIRD